MTYLDAMADGSSIEWTEATWNPTTGCDRISSGCDNCYALTLAKRLKAMGNPKYQADGDSRTSGPGFAITEHPSALDIPRRWSAPRLIFVNSMSDLFHARVSSSFIRDVFQVMEETPRHTYQLLTKRPRRAARMAAELKVTRISYLDTARGLLTRQDPKQFLFFTRTSNGRRAGKEFLARLEERTNDRDKAISVRSFRAQLKAIHGWGQQKPADLASIHQPVLLMNGDSDKMVPTKNTVDLDRRLPNSHLVIYPDAGHGGVFQFHEDFVKRALAFL